MWQDIITISPGIEAQPVVESTRLDGTLTYSVDLEFRLKEPGRWDPAWFVDVSIDSVTVATNKRVKNTTNANLIKTYKYSTRNGKITRTLTDDYSTRQITIKVDFRDANDVEGSATWTVQLDRAASPTLTEWKATQTRNGNRVSVSIHAEANHGYGATSIRQWGIAYQVKGSGVPIDVATLYPQPDGSIDITPETVWASLATLYPLTTYEFVFMIANTAGVTSQMYRKYVTTLPPELGYIVTSDGEKRIEQGWIITKDGKKQIKRLEVV